MVEEWLDFFGYDFKINIFNLGYIEMNKYR